MQNNASYGDHATRTYFPSGNTLMSSK